MQQLNSGDYVKYLNLTWMVYGRPQVKTRKDGSTFEAVRLCKPPVGEFWHLKYPRNKMCGVPVRDIKKIDRLTKS